MKVRTVVALALAALAPSLACDTKVTPETATEFARNGLSIRETQLLRFADGTQLDYRSAARASLRSRGAAPERERVQVVARTRTRPAVKSVDEVVLFAGEHQASTFFAAHGIDEDAVIGELVAPLPPQTNGWLARPGAAGGLTTRSGVPIVYPARAADDLASGGNDGPGRPPRGPGDWSGGDAGSVTRFVMNDGLPLHAAPNFGSAELMQMERGDRVFVYGTLPVFAAGNVFVEVQAIDRSPYPVGWMPLHWLVVSPVGDAQATLDFRASFGLMAKVAKEFIQGAFYHGCDGYPRYPQDGVFGSAPQLENPGAIPYAQRYECGEIPVGEIQSSAWKLLTNYQFTTPEVNFEIIKDKPLLHIDALDFNVPVMMYRLPSQTRENYTMQDLSSGTSQGGVDAVEHTMFAKFANAIEESAVRVHDTDFWFKLTWDAPNGITPVAGASGYFNFCWQLPGGKIEGGYAPLDITIQGAGESHVTGVTWGAVEYAPLRVCGTAALRSDPSNIEEDLTNGAQPPIRVQFVKASIQGLELSFVERPNLYGSFAGVHAVVIGKLIDFVSDFAEDDRVTGLLWNVFLKERLEDRLAGYLFDIGARLAQRMPNPKTELIDACDTLMPAYSSPTSPYYPLYQQCVQAANTASIAYFTNDTTVGSTCYEGPYARANDGSAWTSKSDTHDVYYMPNSENAVGIDKPFWVDGCHVEAELQTTVMSGYEELLACASEVFDEGVNYRRSRGWIQTQLQSRCLTPAVGMLCDAYGEGDDLTGLWSQQLGVEVDVDDVFGFCRWYDDLTREDTPDLHSGS
jgi:hypothetical protein